MLITPSFKKSLIVEQFQGNYLKTLATFVNSHNNVMYSLNYFFQFFARPL